MIAPRRTLDRPTTRGTARAARSDEDGFAGAHNTSRVSSASGGGLGMASARPLTARMKFHFFSFQIHGTTGFMGHA